MYTISEYYKLESLLNESICFNSDSSLDILLEMLSLKLDIDDYIPNLLLENININTIFSDFIPLIESVDEIKEIENDIKNLKNNSNNNEKNDSIIKKCVKSLKSLVDWWYKIEPDKKFKTLHIVLKILVKVAIIIANMYFSNKISKGVMATKAVSKIPDIVLHANKKNISIKSGVVFTIISTALDKVVDFVQSSINDKIEYNINKIDLNKNISEIDKIIDKINNQLEKENDPEINIKLIKMKRDLSDTLSKLIKLRDKQIRRQMAKK